ncbi:MAG: hypothetical protein AB4426_11350 [Xenococcaceae cyanobacterium]
MIGQKKAKASSLRTSGLFSAIATRCAQRQKASASAATRCATLGRSLV